MLGTHTSESDASVGHGNFAAVANWAICFALQAESFDGSHGAQILGDAG